MSESQGVIYILTNPSFPDYVKIGYADDVQKRLKELNRSECIPFAFRLYAYYKVPRRLTDMKLHQMIDKLNPNLRSIEEFDGKTRKREFYNMSRPMPIQSSRPSPRLPAPRETWSWSSQARRK